jgi:hypothetical protein
MISLFQFTKYLLIIEVLAAIAGCITYSKWKNSYLKWFVIYLCVIVISETCSRMIHIKSENGVNYFTLIIVPIEILFMNLFFYKSLSSNRKILIIIGSALYIISWLVENTIFNKADYYFRSLSYTFGNLFIAIYTILYFIEFVNSSKILGYKKSAVFWIVLGMLVFYVGTFPFYGLYNELAKNLDIFYPVAWVAMSLNYCMYLLFTIGFIWGKAH